MRLKVSLTQTIRQLLTKKKKKSLTFSSLCKKQNFDHNRDLFRSLGSALEDQEPQNWPWGTRVFDQIRGLGVWLPCFPSKTRAPLNRIPVIFFLMEGASMPVDSHPAPFFHIWSFHTIAMQSTGCVCLTISKFTFESFAVGWKNCKKKKYKLITYSLINFMSRITLSLICNKDKTQFLQKGSLMIKRLLAIEPQRLIMNSFLQFSLLSQVVGWHSGKTVSF